MTTIASPSYATALRRAAARATRAPSIHNTQPWRLHLHDEWLDISADRRRWLPVLDPAGRQLLISCGCAIMNARVSLAASGLGVEISRATHPRRAELLASLVPSDQRPDLALARLDPVIGLQPTGQRQPSDERVPDAVVESLQEAAATESASLAVVRGEDRRIAVATLSRYAHQVESLNPARRAELRAWTADSRSWRHGVPERTGPRVDVVGRHAVSMHGLHSRDNRVRHPSRNQTVAALCTNGDSAAEWLRAGEALERVLLEITRQGYSADTLTQVIELPSTRSQLRRELRLVGYPHLLLRIGRSPMGPSSRRRRLADVSVDEA